MKRIRTFTLCDLNNPQTPGCPRVRITKKFVVITDDFGGSVKIPAKNWKILVGKIKNKEII